MHEHTSRLGILIYTCIARTVPRFHALSLYVVLLLFCLVFPCMPLMKMGRKLSGMTPSTCVFISLLAFLSQCHLFKYSYKERRLSIFLLGLPLDAVNFKSFLLWLMIMFYKTYSPCYRVAIWWAVITANKKCIFHDSSVFLCEKSMQWPTESQLFIGYVIGTECCEFLAVLQLQTEQQSQVVKHL